MVAISAAVAVALALESARADQSRGGQAVVPADVPANLRTDYGITIATPPRGVSPSVAAGQARSLAVREYGFLGGSPVSAHLVLFSDPVFGDAANEIEAAEDDAVITLLYVNRLAWLVVVRDATPAIHGPPGRPGPGTYDATVAVFIDAKSGADLMAVTLPPG